MFKFLLSQDGLKSVSVVLAAVAGIIISIGIINSRFIAPFLAKPLAKALRKELLETIEAILLSDEIMEQFSEHIQEVVANENQVIIKEVGNLSNRVTSLEKTIKRSPSKRTRSTD